MNDAADTIGSVIIAFILIALLVALIMIPVSCHQEIVRTQALMKKSGIEMTYWDIFWIRPEVRYNQGELKIVED